MSFEELLNDLQGQANDSAPTPEDIQRHLLELDGSTDNGPQERDFSQSADGDDDQNAQLTAA